MKNYYIYFKEPFCVKAKNEDEALERFSDAIYRNIDRYFYTDTKSQTEKDEHNLANFFVSEWGDDILRDQKNMSKKELWEVAMKGVEYWYSGKIDGTQWDCLMKGLEDWKNCRI